MSVFNSVRNILVPVRREGFIFIFAFALAACLLGLLWQGLFWMGLGLAIWCAVFFRDPPRTVPIHDDFILSPADGIVCGIVECEPPSEMEIGYKNMTRISVFMNVFNCHVNRAPVRGNVRFVNHIQGAFFSADLDKASEKNERNVMVIDSPKGEIGIVQIAGLIARRIVCWKKIGDQIVQGERFGLIRFGSRLDVFVPEKAKVQVFEGQKMTAGESVIAAYAESPKKGERDGSVNPARI